MYGSSAGAYSEAPGGVLVDENWPTSGVASSGVSRQIAQGEHLVDEFEASHQIIRVVRLRPGPIVCPRKPPVWGEPLGRRVVGRLVAGRRHRIVPDLGARGIQVVHVSDLVDAFTLAVTTSVVGGFNLAADPITSDMLQKCSEPKRPVCPWPLF